MRNLFDILLIQACPSNPAELWQEFQNEMSKDFFHALQLTEEAAYNMALLKVEDIIFTIDGSSLETYGFTKMQMEEWAKNIQEKNTITVKTSNAWLNLICNT